MDQSDIDSIDLSESYVYEILKVSENKITNSVGDNWSSESVSMPGSPLLQLTSLRLVETIIRVIPTFTGENIVEYATFVEACELMAGVIPIE